MSETYEPGTLAMVTLDGGERVRAMRLEDEDAWRTQDDIWLDRRDGSYTVSDVRPLVVLDLSAGTTEEYLGAIRDLACVTPPLFPTQRSLDLVRHLGNQIEAQTKPPKPAEPTGLGAVVKDAHGRLWVRGGASHMHDNWRAVGMDEWTSYADIDAVGEPLSAGVEIGE